MNPTRVRIRSPSSSPSSQSPFVAPAGFRSHPAKEGSNPNLCQVDRSQIYREQHERGRKANQSDGGHDYGDRHGCQNRNPKPEATPA